MSKPVLDRKADDRIAQARALEQAMQLAVRDALVQHKRAGNPVCTWRDDKVVWIPADEIQIDEEASGG